MTRLVLPATCLLAVLILVACGASPSPDLSAQQSNLEAQLASVRRQQTATANAVAAKATAEVKATRQAMDAANATATAEAKQTAQAQAAALATMQAYTFNLTATADALNIAQQQAQATATAQAREIQVSLDKQSATATAQAMEYQRLQAEQDARTARRNAEFFSYFWPVVLVLATLAAFIFALYAVNQWVMVFALRRMVIETRTGTVFFIRDGHNQFTAQLLNAPTMPPTFETQATVIDAEADMLKVNTTRGTTYIAKHDPQHEAAEANRRLALRLLRAAMQQVGGNANRIPTAKDLAWPPATWVKAVSLLKPHVTTREGRGGGTFCADNYPTLAQLYAAVGERRITPLSQVGVTS